MCVRACVQHQLLIETDDATNQPVCRRLVLEFGDEEKKDAVVEVHKKLVQQLKPHQAEGRLIARDGLSAGSYRPHTVMKECMQLDHHMQITVMCILKTE